MGKGARNRRSRQLQPAASPLQPTATWNMVGGSRQERQEKMIEVLQNVDMPCRTTTSSDPVFGGPGAMISDILPDGTVLTDPYDTVPVLPVAMFEPTQVMAVKDLRTSTFHEPRMEHIISSGFHRQPRGMLANLPAEGWGLYRTNTGLLLRDQFGGVWAKSEVTLAPGWLALAAQHFWVTVYYGPWLGVRLPEGKTDQTYTVQDRIAEFKRGREQGLCAAASVRWHPEIFDQTMDWVLLPAGTFGQPYPIAYVPAWNFDHLGGPETFGLEPVTLHSHGMGPVPAAHDLAVDVTSTDVDFFQPHLDTAINFVAGYRVPAGQPDPPFNAWQQRALQSGKVLLITGSKDIPAGPALINEDPNDVMARVKEALCTSHAALVPIGVPRRASLT
ncbi:hypothetical protein [Spirillospora sp. CA-128828]|uniref:hypothetical protein n=1 Tax=Spirillospora sp. CA-128828 TaxID=3240033 RepID=UPI003D8AA1C6